MKSASAKPSCNRCVPAARYSVHVAQPQNQRMIVCEVIGSSPAVGESYSTIGGWLISALAIETLRFMPPIIPTATAPWCAPAQQTANTSRTARLDLFLGNSVFAQAGRLRSLRPSSNRKARPPEHKSDLPPKRQQLVLFHLRHFIPSTTTSAVGASNPAAIFKSVFSVPVSPSRISVSRSRTGTSLRAALGPRRTHPHVLERDGRSYAGPSLAYAHQANCDL